MPPSRCLRRARDADVRRPCRARSGRPRSGWPTPGRSSRRTRPGTGPARDRLGAGAPAGRHAPVGSRAAAAGRCRSAGRNPVHQMTASTSCLVPSAHATPGREPGEHRLCLEHAAVAGVADAGDHHDVAQPADPGVLAPLPQRLDAGGGGREQHAAVDVVGQEPRRPGVTQTCRPARTPRPGSGPRSSRRRRPRPAARRTPRGRYAPRAAAGRRTRRRRGRSARTAGPTSRSPTPRPGRETLQPYARTSNAAVAGRRRGARTDVTGAAHGASS